MKFLHFLLVLSASGCLFAEQKEENLTSAQFYIMDENLIYNENSGESIDQIASLQQYNSPGRINVKGPLDIFFTGDFLYWQASQQGLTFARTSNDLVAINPLIDGRYMQPKYQYRPGLKLSAGMFLKHDDWSIFGEWTHIIGEGSKHTNAPGGGVLFPTRVKTALLAGTVPVTASYAKATCKINYNIGDLMLGRPYYVGKSLVFSPNFGFRCSWITEHFNIHYDSVTIGDTDHGTFRLYNVFRSWGLGLRGGLDAKWLLNFYNTFIFGNGDFSLLFTHTHGRSSEANASYANAIGRQNQDVFNAKDKDNNTVNPNADLTAGFGWESYLRGNNLHIALTAAYEYTHWFRHLDLFDEYDGSLSLHGMTLKLRLDF